MMAYYLFGWSRQTPIKRNVSALTIGWFPHPPKIKSYFITHPIGQFSTYLKANKKATPKSKWLLKKF